MRWYNENPKLSSCGTSGAGSVSHFVMIEIARKANSAVVFVHYRSALQQIEALIEGSLKTAVVVPWIALPHVDSGELRVLATTGVARSALLSEVPTMRESGIDVVVREWAGLFAPVGTPQEIVNRLADATAEALATPAVKASFRRFGLDRGEVGPVGFAAMVKADYDRWGGVVKRSGLKAES